MRLTIVFFCLMLYSLTSNCSNLPDLGAPDLKDYDSQTETILGRAFSTALHQQYDLLYDPIILSYIRHIGSKITSETNQNRQFSFYIINDPEINAFAGPNGVIGIHTGLILAAKTEDELASVLAHEIAHVTQRHLSRTYEYQKSVSVTSIASLIAAILVGTQDISAGLATYMGGVGLNIEQQLKNSRIHENEADYFGIKYLDKAGYNPYAMSDFFGRLAQEAQLNEFKAPEILLTHPVTESRLAKAKERAYQLSSSSAPTEYHKRSLQLIKMRLRAILKLPTNYSETPLTANEQCYLNNLNLLLTQNQHNKQAFNRDCLDQATKEFPNNKLYRLQKAEIDSILTPKQGLKEFSYLEAIYPSDFSLPYLHAIVLVKNNRKAEAIKLLKSATPKFHYQYLMYSELAKLYSETNDTKFVYYYDALANYNIGNTAKSLYLIDQAKSLEKDKDGIFYNKLIQLQNQISLDQKLDKHHKTDE